MVLDFNEYLGEGFGAPLAENSLAGDAAWPFEATESAHAEPAFVSDDLAHNHFALLLRGAFEQILEMDFGKDSFRTLLRRGEHFCPLPEGLPLLETMHAYVEHVVHPDDRHLTDTHFSRETLWHLDRSITYDQRLKCPDGAYRWARVVIVPAVQAGETLPGVFLVCIRDVDDEKGTLDTAAPAETINSLRLDDLRHKAVLDHIKTMIFEWSESDAPAYMSPRISQFLSGNYDGRMVFTVWREDKVISPADMPLFVEFLSAVADGQKTADMTVRLKRRDGHYSWCHVSFSVLPDPDHGTRYIGTINDVDEATRNLEVLRFRAEYDSLTGSCNRTSFLEKVTADLENNPDEEHFILRFDVDNFKYFNEFYGMEEGDRLLVELSHLARAAMDIHKEYLCRLTGDMFVVSLVGDMARVEAFVRHITEGIRDFSPSCKISVFFGICPVTDCYTPVHILSSRAQDALKTVKGSDLANFAVYNNPLRDRLLEENRIVEQMHAALEAGEFVPYLQPKVAMFSGRVVGAEALVRWQHPQEGMLSPGVFIPLFERNGVIVRLDEFMWEATCKLLRRWLDKGYKPVPVSVNVSRVHFLDENFGRRIIALTDKYNIPRHLLELEITESAFFGNERVLVRVMENLQKEGFVFSMDDFGTGYSSLGTLRSLPFNIVKLDRSFISDGTDNPRGQVVARNTVNLARELDMRIVAEGVETEAQVCFLLNIGCTVAQGYYYSQPIDADSFEVLAYVQEKSFWVSPNVQSQANERGLPAGPDRPELEW